MKYLTSVVLGVALLVSFGASAAPVAELKGRNGFPYVDVDIVCIDGYQYVVARTMKGVSITQSFKSSDGMGVQPIECPAK